MTIAEIKAFVASASHLHEIPCTFEEIRSAAEKQTPFGDFIVDGVKVVNTDRQDADGSNYRRVFLVSKQVKKSSMPKFDHHTTPEEKFGGR